MEEVYGDIDIDEQMHQETGLQHPQDVIYEWKTTGRESLGLANQKLTSMLNSSAQTYNKEQIAADWGEGWRVIKLVGKYGQCMKWLYRMD